MPHTPAILYLLPSPLGDTALDVVLPSYNSLIINRIRKFIVEDLRTARRFLKRVNKDFPIDDCTFFELNEHTVDSFDYQIILQLLLDGEDVGLLSDAGLPCVADPGNRIVLLAHEHKITVSPLVGPSSLMLALMASGLNGQNFAFWGYLPAHKAQLPAVVKKAETVSAKLSQTQIFIETPYRNHQLLETLLNTCKPDTLITVAVELTLPSQYIHTQSIREWKKQKIPLLHKKPAVFLLQAF
jgi:16S rRNA (cytidine1402-2'-O)-methyltransferase